MAMRGPIQNILSAKARFNAVAVNPEQLGIRLDEIQSFIADFLYRFKNDEKALLIHYKNNDKFKALRQDFIQKLNKLSIEYKNSHVDWYSSYNQPHMALEGKLLQSLSKLFIPLHDKVSMGSNIKNGHFVNGLIEKFKNFVIERCKSKQNFLYSLTHITQTLSCLHDFNLDYLSNDVHAKCDNVNDPTYLFNQGHFGHGIKAYEEIDSILKAIFQATLHHLDELDAISLVHLMHATILLSEHKNFQPVSEATAKRIFDRMETDMLNSQQDVLSNDMISKLFTFKNAYPNIFPEELNTALANRSKAMATHDSTFENSVLQKIQQAFTPLNNAFPGLMNLEYFSKNPLDAESGRESDLAYHDPVNGLYLSFQVDGDKYHTYDGNTTTIKTKFRDFCLGNKYTVINIRDDQNSIEQIQTLLVEYIIRPTLNVKVFALMENFHNKNSEKMLQSLLTEITNYKNTIHDPERIIPFEQMENKLIACLEKLGSLSIPSAFTVEISLSKDFMQAQDHKEANKNSMINLEKEILTLKDSLKSMEHSCQKAQEELDLTNMQNEAILQQRMDIDKKIKKYKGKPEIVYNANKKEIDDFIAKYSQKGNAPNKPNTKLNFVISKLERFDKPTISTAALELKLEKLKNEKNAMDEKIQGLQQDLIHKQALEKELDKRLTTLKALERSMVDFNKLNVEANQYPTEFEGLKQDYANYLNAQNALKNQLHLRNSHGRNSGNYPNFRNSGNYQNFRNSGNYQNGLQGDSESSPNQRRRKARR